MIPNAKSSAKTESVKVAVRVRPFNASEKASKSPSIVNVQGHQIIVDRPNNEQKSFTFDYVYPAGIGQSSVFEEVARPIVDSVLNGYNGTIFAYGQTGTGKTYTMEGDVDNEKERGILPNTFHHVFREIEQASKNTEYLVRVSFIEIYNDDVFDLLSNDRAKRSLKEVQGGFQVRDLITITVNSAADTVKALRMGQKNRSVGATKMNPGSSRSHSIFTLSVDQCQRDGEQTQYRAGKLNMVDLAGSERQKKTEATGERLEEAKNINLSLSALGNVINALVKPKSGHVPFRDSKLTRLLQDSLGGNTKTVMIAAIGPAESNLDETMSTLRYAHRAKGIMNIPVVNEDPKDAILRQYQDEIETLKKQLDEKRQILEEEHVVEKIVFQHEMSEQEKAELEKQTKIELERFASLHEEEKQKILASKSEVEQAALMYELELQKSHDQLLKEREEIALLESKLREKEMKLLVGGQDFKAAEEQHKKLMETEESLQEQLEKERQLQAHLEEAEEAELYMNEQYSSRQEELDKKTKKLKSLWNKYKEKVEDLKDIQNEFDLESEDLMESIRDLTAQLTVKNCLINELISPAHRAIIETRCHWDAYVEEWTISHIEYAANNIESNPGQASTGKGHRRLSTAERIAALLDKDARNGGLLMETNKNGSVNSAALKAALQNLRSPPDLSAAYFTYSGAKLKTKKSRTKNGRRK